MQPENILPEGELSINDLLSLESIMPIHLARLKKEDRETFDSLMCNNINMLTDVERDAFYKKVEFVTTNDVKNRVWENNHDRITDAVYIYVTAYKRMPSNTELAQETRLSRNTVQKHMKEFSFNPGYLDKIDQLRSLAPRVLMAIAEKALEGNVAAAKLYFQMINEEYKPRNKGDIAKEDYKYVAINELVLDEEKVQKLPPEDRQAIVAIVRKTIPKHKEAASDTWILAMKLAGIEKEPWMIFDSPPEESS